MFEFIIIFGLSFLFVAYCLRSGNTSLLIKTITWEIFIIFMLLQILFFTNTVYPYLINNANNQICSYAGNKLYKDYNVSCYVTKNNNSKMFYVECECDNRIRFNQSKITR